MTRRLTAQAWIDFALTTLRREGFAALKADVLARKLGVSRGSFYWHFAELADFHAHLIERWREMATEAIIADVERYGSAEQRLSALLRRAFGHDGLLEIRMRAWADDNAQAARALGDIDRRRQMYLERLLGDAGITPPLAAMRAQLLYWSYLGAALSRCTPKGARLEAVVAELIRIGLGESAQTAAVDDGRSPRTPRRRSRRATPPAASARNVASPR
jgi:AcrR family transcriptional regulator